MGYRQLQCTAPISTVKRSNYGDRVSVSHTGIVHVTYYPAARLRSPKASDQPSNFNECVAAVAAYGVDRTPNIDKGVEREYFLARACMKVVGGIEFGDLVSSCYQSNVPPISRRSFCNHAGFT